MGTAVSRRSGGAACAALALAALACLCWAPAAGADTEFCPPGEGAGECAPPPISEFNTQRGLAIDHEAGVLYLADRENNRVNAFAEDGEFLFAFGWGVDSGAAALETCTGASGCQKGIAGSGAGQLSLPSKVAVDNDPASPNHQLLYVAEAGNARVQLFDPAPLPVSFVRSVGSSGSGEGQISGPPAVRVGPAGVLYVLDNVAGQHRLQRFDAGGALIPPQCLLFEGGTARSLAVGPAGEFWVANEGANEGVRKYDPGCGPPLLAEGSDEIENNQVAVDEAGNPFAAQREVREAGGSFRVITAFDRATGAIVRRFAYGKLPASFRPEAILPRSEGEGGIFASVRQESFLAKRMEFTGATMPDPGPLPAPPTLEVAELGSTRAKLVAEVNPEGKATEVHVEYLTEEEFEEQGESFEGGLTKSSEPQPLGAEGFDLKGTEAQIGCPNPAVEALEPVNDCLIPDTLYRWRVVATNEDNESGAGESSVEGIPFETKPAPDLGELYATRVGTDVARLNGEVNPTGIPASGWFEYVDDAAYRADIEAGGDGFAAATQAPDVGAGQAPLDFGSGEGLITRRVTIFPLAPGTLYHYRLVVDSPLIEPVASPAEELRTFGAGSAPCPNDAGRIGAGAFLPDCRAYEMVSPPDKEGGDVRVGETTLAEPAVLEQSAASGEKLAFGSFRSFGGADSAPFTSQYIARRVAGVEWETHPINPPRGRAILKVIQQLDTEFKAFSADLCQAWLTSFAEYPAPAPPGYLAGYSNLLRRTDELCNGGTAGYEALAPLGAPPGIPPGPDFVMTPLGVSAGGGQAIFLANGKLTPEGSEGHRQLYESTPAGLRFVCVLPGGEPVDSACTAGSATVSGLQGVQSGRISADGGRIFWSAPATGEGKLYVRIDGAQTVAVSEGGEAQSGTSASWFWGAAADGSAAVFSTGVAPNNSDLYEFDVETEATSPIAEEVVGVLGVSEDAARVYFASRKALTATPNSAGDKAEAGKANLYLREAGGGIEFVATLAGADLEAAVSSVFYFDRTSRIAPDGAHATFVSVAPLTGYDNKDAQSGAPTEQVYRYDAEANLLLCVSCNPSLARPEGPARLPRWQTGSHAARVLADDGSRLYFESADALAARDSNGKIDVYQWEEPGAGSCSAASPSFSPEAGGCVDLISSGQSPLDSRFVEASPTGDDVFFATGTSLLPQDTGVVDIYDARVNGGLPVPPVPPAPCEGDACAAQIPAPEAQTPASSAFRAPGDVAGASSCTPPARRAKKLARRAERLRAAARRAAPRGPRRALAQKARRLSRQAAKQAERAKRCRARARRAAR